MGEHVCEPQPGEMHPVDQAFYDLTVKERDHAWLESARHKEERDEARAALAQCTEDYKSAAAEAKRYRADAERLVYARARIAELEQRLNGR